MSKNAAEEFCSRSFEERRELCRKVKKEWPAMLPVILNASAFKGDLPAEYKWKYLCPQHYMLNQFFYEVIRGGMKISFNESIHFNFFDSAGRYILPPMSENMTEIYNKYCSADGFLYVYISKENTFG